MRKILALKGHRVAEHFLGQNPHGLVTVVTACVAVDNEGWGLAT